MHDDIETFNENTPGVKAASYPAYWVSLPTEFVLFEFSYYVSLKWLCDFVRTSKIEQRLRIELPTKHNKSSTKTEEIFRQNFCEHYLGHLFIYLLGWHLKTSPALVKNCKWSARPITTKNSKKYGNVIANKDRHWINRLMVSFCFLIF